jgi:hypothetical protein
MRTVSKKVLNFSELSKSAQANALDNVRIHGQYPFENWSECTINDYREACALIGIEIEEGKVYFSGFSSQGDGACFECTYAYKKGGLAAIKAEFPTLTAMHDVAESLQLIQSKYFYGINAIVKQSGRYSHSNCTTIEYYVSRKDKDGASYDDHFASDDFYEEANDLLRSIMNQVYRALEKQYDFLNEDEQVKEYINEDCVEFEENGQLFSVHA